MKITISKKNDNIKANVGAKKAMKDDIH